MVYLIPFLVILKFLDAYLTIWVYHTYKQFGRKYLMLESFEANPNWKKDVEHGFKSWKHFTFLFALVILLSYLFSVEPYGFAYEFFSGFSLFLYLAINFEHLSHLREMAQMPGRVSGKLFYSLDYYFSTASHNYVKYSAMLFFAWIATQSAFICGAVFGPLFIAALIKVRWDAYSSDKK